MINIDENNKEKCCGCTACFNICPKNAIRMEEDIEGFLYPTIDKEKCIKCDLCNKICPIINKKNSVVNPKLYAIRCKNDQILEESTSGGVFTPIAEYVIKNKGVIYGVGYSKDSLVIEYQKVSKNENLKNLRGSKYVQSYLNDTFLLIKKDLMEGKLVLFVGNPCYVEGLMNFLQKKYDRLITIDFICKGVPSPKLWEKYKEYQTKKYNSKLRYAKFRNKTYGYHSGTMKLDFENGKNYYSSGRTDYFLKLFFSELTSRPSCYSCVFKKKEHISDFTIYECWNFQKLVKKIKDDDKGYTSVLVNSNKGQELLDKIEDKVEKYIIDKEESFKLDGIMLEKSAIPHKNRNEFYKKLQEESLENIVQQYIPITKKDKLIEKSKMFLHKAGILRLIKKMKGIKNHEKLKKLKN